MTGETLFAIGTAATVIGCARALIRDHVQSVPAETTCPHCLQRTGNIEHHLRDAGSIPTQRAVELGHCPYLHNKRNQRVAVRTISPWHPAT